MGEIIEKLGRVIDHIAEELTKDEFSLNQVELYRFSDFSCFAKQMVRENASIKKFKISVLRSDRYEEIVFPESKYIIRILCLDKNSEPVLFDSIPGEYKGTMVIASGIDSKFNAFMNGKTEKTVVYKGE